MTGDSVFVFMKGMKTKPDGVYVAGRVTSVDHDAGVFGWSPLQSLSNRLLKRPVVAADVRATFGRLYGGSLQLLPIERTARWMSLVRSKRTPSEESADAAVDAATSELETAGLKQGFASSAALRKVLEDYSVSLAVAYYKKRGFTVELLGKPYDLNCVKGQHRLFVEVKGTTTSGEEVLLTPNEVEFTRQNAEKMELFVVSGINVLDTGNRLVASGGASWLVSPWRPASRDLTPIGFSCAVRAQVRVG